MSRRKEMEGKTQHFQNLTMYSAIEQGSSNFKGHVFSQSIFSNHMALEWKSVTKG